MAKSFIGSGKQIEWYICLYIMTYNGSAHWIVISLNTLYYLHCSIHNPSIWDLWFNVIGSLVDTTVVEYCHFCIIWLLPSRTLRTTITHKRHKQDWAY